MNPPTTNGTRERPTGHRDLKIAQLVGAALFIVAIVTWIAGASAWGNGAAAGAVGIVVSANVIWWWRGRPRRTRAVRGPWGARQLGDRSGEDLTMSRGKYGAGIHVFAAFLEYVCLVFVLVVAASGTAGSPWSIAIGLLAGMALALTLFWDHWRVAEAYGSRFCTGMLNVSVFLVPPIILLFLHVRLVERLVAWQRSLSRRPGGDLGRRRPPVRQEGVIDDADPTVSREDIATAEPRRQIPMTVGSVTEAPASHKSAIPADELADASRAGMGGVRDLIDKYGDDAVAAGMGMTPRKLRSEMMWGRVPAPPSRTSVNVAPAHSSPHPLRPSSPREEAEAPAKSLDLRVAGSVGYFVGRIVGTLSDLDWSDVWSRLSRSSLKTRVPPAAGTEAEDARPNTEERMRNSLKWCAVVVGLSLLLAFGWTVWPTPYREFHLGQAPFREHRITGSIYRFTGSGWAEVPRSDSGARSGDEELPADALRQLAAKGKFSGSYWTIDVYNGSTWRVTGIRAHFESVAGESRDYDFALGTGNHGDPLRNSEFWSAGDATFGQVKLWSIAAARGRNVQ